MQIPTTPLPTKRVVGLPLAHARGSVRKRRGSTMRRFFGTPETLNLKPETIKLTAGIHEN
jgi:hypothetical protein